MKKKNGFISTSIIYSFFLVFVTLFLALILNYMHNQILLSKINESARNDIDKIKNARISNLNIGDYVVFELKDDHSDVINEVSYILANKYDDNTYEFFTTANTFNNAYNNNTEFLTIDNFNNIDIKSMYKYSDINTITTNIITSDSLKRVRDNVTDENILDDIYDISSDYIVFNNITGTPYENNRYYNMRKYSLSSDNTNDLFTDNTPEALSDLMSSYCNLSYGDRIVYPDSNPFGYGNLLNATISTPKYINYCYYANPINYTHDAKDGIVSKTETVESDLIANDNPSTAEAEQKGLTYRSAIRVNISGNPDKDYFISGKGTKEDPYILRTGGKE